MGVILSKFRKSKPSLGDQLEKIDKELTEIRRFNIDTEVEQKRIIGRLTIFLFVVYILGILAYYLFIKTEELSWGQLLFSLLPFVVFPLFIWSLRRLFNWWYQRQIVNNKDRADGLRKERERLLDEVMETETFKVAKKILEKYAPSHLLPKYLAEQQQQRSLPGTPLGNRPLAQNDGLRRRTIGPGPMMQPMGRGFVGRPMGPGMPPGNFRPQMRAIMGAPPGPGYRGPSPAMSSVPTGFTPMRYMLPPIPSAPTLHNRKTGWMDKVVDYVIGDGPTHRYALICRYCATHNGLATPEDFPYTGYRCIYCRQFNPPKQQRPSAQTLPRNTVLIEEMESSSPSIKDNSETEGDSEAEQANKSNPNSPASGRKSSEPIIDLQGSTSDLSTKGVEENETIEEEVDNNEERESPIPFADEDESSVKESVPSANEDQESSSVVGKLSVNIRPEETDAAGPSSSSSVADPRE